MVASQTMEPIRIWNRTLQQEEIETVYGGKAISFLYGHPFGQTLAQFILSGKFFSRAYGTFQDTVFSSSEISRFINAYKIPMQEYEEGPFRTFNDFFIRKFKEGKRQFVADPKRMGAFAEGRYFAFSNAGQSDILPVKSFSLTPKQLLGRHGGKWVQTFENGPVLISRLCPVDYHRFHFPDDGSIIEQYRESGKLHSVNPAALKFKKDIFLTNERQITILDTKNFGKLAYIEVGAMSVGRIVQTHPQKEFKRGDEKGYFLFGGSTVLIIGEPGCWTPSPDLLEQTQKFERETLVTLGQEVAVAT